ncbi:MAG: hydroxymethylbilane synthase [Planctomycetes bacterium]|nr:hydroxymethylbilane synthase [Planctomycetota bacterium]
MITIRLGTRASALARWQANWVADALRRLGHEVTLVPITTTGDQQTDAPIRAMSGVGIFTKEIQRALIEGSIDLAVHSLKDLPTDPEPHLALAAVPSRESVSDVLVSREDVLLEALPLGARIGTGSLRRRAQLLHLRPDLTMVEVRGNVETRLRKLDEGQFDALVLAEAGLIRLGLSDRITQVIPATIMLPAPGQGALGLETRSDDAATRGAVEALSDRSALAGVLAEREVLRVLGGGCLAPIGAWGRILSSGKLALDAVVLSPDGQGRLAATAEGEPADPLGLGRRVAQELLAQGGAELLAAARHP